MLRREVLLGFSSAWNKVSRDLIPLFIIIEGRKVLAKTKQNRKGYLTHFRLQRVNSLARYGMHPSTRWSRRIVTDSRLAWTT